MAWRKAYKGTRLRNIRYQERVLAAGLGKSAVGAYGVNIIGIEHRNAFGFHFGREFLTVLNEQVAVYRVVFHNL